MNPAVACACQSLRAAASHGGASAIACACCARRYSHTSAWESRTQNPEFRYCMFELPTV
jgi:hypothetical protein